MPLKPAEGHGGVRRMITQQIIEKISLEIVEEKLIPGEKLPSGKELIEKLQVGRSSIREPLHALVALGVLRAEAGKGYFVREDCSLPIDNALLFKLGSGRRRFS